MDESKGGEESPSLHDDQVANKEATGAELTTVPAPRTGVSAGAGGSRKPPPPDDDEPDTDEDGMLRMSFLEHLEELRSRLIKMLAGFGVIFLGCMLAAHPLWEIVQAPAADALRGLHQGKLVAIGVMEQFSIIYVWTPVVAAIFLGSPWIIYQIWAFIAPGLYKRERRWAVPFVLVTAALFILGGVFAYFIAFRYALKFLLGIGSFSGVESMISIEAYFDTFVDVMLGVSLVFEMPVVIFFLTLLRLASPTWLLKHSRYAVLGITIIAAIVTPTPDAFTMTLLAVPMCMLYFVGVFAGYLLVLHREQRRFPWSKVLPWVGLALLVLIAFGAFEAHHYHMHLIRHWPYLTK
jgi:sec-independent protein translocase protein TatC